MTIAFRRLDIVIMEPGAPPDRNPRVLVSWELVRQWSDLPTTLFSIERSLSESFPVDDVESIGEISGVEGQWVYSFVDVTPNLFSFWRHYFYRIKAVVGGTETVFSQTRTWEASPRTHELAIIERHDFVLQYIQGSPSFAFVERTADAASCPCFSKTAGRPSRSDCTLCLGTGKLRPYFDPIPFFVDYNPDEKLTQISSFGEVQINEKDFWSSAFPLLKPRDVIYEVMPALLWRVVNLKPIQPQGTTIQHVGRLAAIEHSSVEYKRLVQQISQATLEDIVKTWERNKSERMF